jgi:hypothetical protein
MAQVLDAQRLVDELATKTSSLSRREIDVGRTEEAQALSKLLDQLLEDLGHPRCHYSARPMSFRPRPVWE